jgi:hypothetical protein
MAMYWYLAARTLCFHGIMPLADGEHPLLGSDASA